MKDVPVLRLAERGRPALLDLVEQLDLEAREERLDLGARKEREVALPSPAVAVSEELPAEAAARKQRLDDASPHAPERPGCAEGQRPARVHELDAWKRGLLEAGNL